MSPVETIVQAMLSGYKGSFTELLAAQGMPAEPMPEPTVPVIPQQPVQIPQRPEPTLVRSYAPTEPGIQELRTDTRATVLTDPSVYASGGYASKARTFMSDYLKRK